jgi:hypothetical protein
MSDVLQDLRFKARDNGRLPVPVSEANSLQIFPLIAPFAIVVGRRCLACRFHGVFRRSLDGREQRRPGIRCSATGKGSE